MSEQINDLVYAIRELADATDCILSAFIPASEAAEKEMLEVRRMIDRARQAALRCAE